VEDFVMSEFKGTKGEWKVDYGGEITSNNRFICDCATLTEEDRYNAQLISCAPEMLEMLQDIANTLENGDTPHVYQIRDLITKATTI
jgi:predicted HD phosphohydrolase